MKGDFLGFSFDGIHCSTLGITHVSSSDRYEEELFPEVKDKTIEIPNNHGEYYYGSTYGTRTFEIDIAYDSVTETQFHNIRRLFGTKKICELIFDERPYKVYYAKIESPIEMSYICFDEEEYTWETEGHDNYIPGSVDHKVYTGKKRRIYKGEGTINLICYQPFAHQLFKIKELYERAGENQGNLVTTYSNVDEWIESSGILTEEEWNTYHIDQVVDASAPYTYAIPVYNPGDLNVGFCLYIPFTQVTTEVESSDPIITYKILPSDENSDIIINGEEKILVLKEITRKKNDTATGILINTINHLIEGVELTEVADNKDYRTPSWHTTGTLYNEYIKEGDFPYIKRNDWSLDNNSRSQNIYISCASIEGNKQISIHYDYLYF